MRERRAALVLYPTVENEPRLSSRGMIDPGDVVLAFCLVAPTSPKGGQRSLVRFRAVDSSRSNIAVVDRVQGEA
ncbi:hypothetical protein ACIQM3_12965 [Streptomyces sp. NPDC091271]|uniref:hypothetical protein n=1 Tax=Streptomyces sp. NPDC091271 TaxID=3365980 RepID=UPI003805B050